MLERTGTLATVSLSHPGKFNAMSRSMWRELRQVFEALQLDPGLRCVLLRGANGHFCAGGDISEYPEFRFTEAGLRQFHESDVWGALQAMLDCDLPLVAQIEGNCLGAGVEIACCCDIRIAEASARFGAPIARLGFPMAPREAALVRREFGAARVREMLLEAAVFSAAQMQSAGFLNRVSAQDQCASEAEAAARRIAALAPQAARLNKQTLRALSAAESNGGSQFDEHLKHAYVYADSQEHRKGIMAFIEKRRSDF